MLNRWRRSNSTMIQTTTKWRLLDCKPGCFFAITENLRTDCYHYLLIFKLCLVLNTHCIDSYIYLGALGVERKTCGSKQLIHCCHSMQIDYNTACLTLITVFTVSSFAMLILFKQQFIQLQQDAHQHDVQQDDQPPDECWVIIRLKMHTKEIGDLSWKTSGKCAVPS